MKILVINLMYLGDLLFMTPLLHALKTAQPDAQLDILVDTGCKDVIRCNQYVDTVRLMEKKGRHGTVVGYWGLVGELRAARYDLVINLHANERATALAGCSGAARRVGFAARPLRWMMTQPVPERTDMHQADAYLEVLRALGLPTEPHAGLEMWVDEVAEGNADAKWAAAGLDGATVVGLNTGGSWPTKRWTVEGFAGVADRLAARGLTPVFFGGPQDQGMVEQIVAQTACAPVVFTGKISLQELAVMAGRCRAFISGDSGPMHIAVSQRTPVVAIFGPSNPMRYAPYQIPHRVLRADEPCLGCGEHACDHHRCMRTITPDQVLAALDALVPELVKVASSSSIR